MNNNNVLDPIPLPLHLSSFGYINSDFDQVVAREDDSTRNGSNSEDDDSLTSSLPVSLVFTPTSPLRYHALKHVDNMQEKQKEENSKDALFHLMKIRQTKFKKQQNKLEAQMQRQQQQQSQQFNPNNQIRLSMSQYGAKSLALSINANTTSSTTNLLDGDHYLRHNFLDSPIFPATKKSKQFPIPAYKTSEIYADKTYEESQQQHQFLVYPPWLAVANATRSGASNEQLEKYEREYEHEYEHAAAHEHELNPEPNFNFTMSPKKPNSPFQTSLPANTPIFFHGEKAQACTAIQKSWRGFIARVSIWRFGGRGTHYMGEKIQRRYRGVLGRRRAAQRWLDRDEEKAQLMIDLYWGFKVSERAKRASFEEDEMLAMNPAKCLQT